MGHHRFHQDGTVSHLGNEIWGDKQAQKRRVPAWCGNARNDLRPAAQEPGRMGEAVLSTVTFVLFVLGEGWPS